MSQRLSEQNYYDILEISSAAAHHEIVLAYQRAKDAYSPDSPALYTMFSKEEAAELRKLVEEAFLVLGNQTKRKEYDMILVAREKRTQVMHLPDLGTIPEATTSPQSMRHTPAPAPAVLPTNVPDGFAKTRLSVYEVKPDVEKEIAEQTIFDGPFFRKVRQYKNINLDQLSKETRISRSYLAAVEADDFDALPAPVFVRGFVAQMARILGLSEAATMTSYMSRFKKESQ
jgi:curved DNA-binding protein CbpA